MAIAAVEVQVFFSAPFRNKIGNGRPVGRLFLDFGGAKASCFLGGNEEIGRRLRRHFCFVFLGSTRIFRDKATFWQVNRHLLRFYRWKRSFLSTFSSVRPTSKRQVKIARFALANASFRSEYPHAWFGTIHALRRRQDSYQAGVAIC